MQLPTKQGGAVFVAIAAGMMADQLGAPWWKSTVITLLVAVGLIAMMLGRPAS